MGNGDAMRFHRSTAEAFRDEMAYSIEGPRGKRITGFYLKRRNWLQRIVQWIKHGLNK